MAYVTAQLNLLVPGVGGAPSLWTYYGTDAHGTVEGADFFSDGAAKGLKVGDVIICNKTSATIESVICYVKTVTAGGAASLQAATLA